MIKHGYDLEAHSLVCEFVNDLLTRPDTFYSYERQYFSDDETGKLNNDHIIDVTYYRQIWYDNILQANRLDLFTAVCHGAPTDKAELLCWMTDKYSIMPSNIIIAKMAYDGELDVFKYCATNNTEWRVTMFEFTAFESHLTWADLIFSYAIHANHINIFDWLYINYIKIHDHSRLFDVNRICDMIRYNRIDLYRKI